MGRFLTPDPLGITDSTNLYAFAKNNPFKYTDLYGLWTSPISLPPSMAYAKEGAIISENIGSLALAAWNNPRFQGGLQAAGGFAEAGVGAGLTYTPFASLGAFLLIHGADQFTTGLNTVIRGSHGTTLTEQLLQSAGMSSEWASFSNNLISVGGVTGSIGLARTFTYQSSRIISQAAMSSFEISANRFEMLQGERIFKPFTESNYRANLKELTGIYPPPNIHAHHVFPQEFEEIFLHKGINIHHPKHLSWWEGKAHQSAANGYNAEWQSFFETNQGATQAQILEEGKRIMNLYGIETNY